MLASYTDPLFQGVSPDHSLDFTYDGNDSMLTASQDAGVTGSAGQLTTTFGYGSPAPGPTGNNPFDPRSITDPQSKVFGVQYGSSTTRDATEVGPYAGGAFQRGSTQTAYNANGTVSSTTDGNSHVTGYSYSPSGTSELDTITPPAA